MFNFSKGQVAGILTGLAAVTTALGLTHVSSILTDPTTATLATAAVGAIGAIVAGHLPGKPAVKPA